MSVVLIGHRISDYHFIHCDDHICITHSHISHALIIHIYYYTCQVVTE